LLHQEKRRADVDGEETIEVIDLGIFDTGRLRDAGVGDEDVEPLAGNRRQPLKGRFRAIPFGIRAPFPSVSGESRLGGARYVAADPFEWDSINLVAGCNLKSLRCIRP
jgi:hypothetical protein